MTKIAGVGPSWAITVLQNCGRMHREDLTLQADENSLPVHCGDCGMPISQRQAEVLGKKYTQAWCSHDPDAVASFYAADGRITINDGDASNGRAEVAEMAKGFF